MRIDIISIFPDYFEPLELSLVGKARQVGVLDILLYDLRDWTHDRHRTVDDTPYGGGAGMVMNPVIWGRAIDAVLSREAVPVNDNSDHGEVQTDPTVSIFPIQTGAPPSQNTVPEDDYSDSSRSEGRPPVLIIPTPAGALFDQATAVELAAADHLVFACGRYEGIDQRVSDYYANRADIIVREISLGDYVLNGGEVAALAMIEAVARLLDGVIGNAQSLVEESHGAAGILEYPVYTKPAEWRGLEVPPVLLSGHHAQIAAWRHDQALRRTAQIRPDLLAAPQSST